jgi:hypothetical protein
MSTRAAIGYERADGTVVAIYSHYDGYPQHVGKILKEHHSNDCAVYSLLEGSQIRNFDNDGTVCRFGEGDGEAEVSEDKEEAIYGYDYLYLWDFDTQKWTCFARDGYVKPESLREIEL